jgi:Mn2+/Fe2+ NRAMP family transporter
MNQHDRELAVIESVADAPALKKFFAYAKLSGPGWLQGAITLGGGSLAGALFLGSTTGYGGMWIQPMAMIFGVIMLSAISYVTLSTGNRPFHAINRHLSPLLGWSWLVATIMANLVWTMPQFALATEAIQQNLLGGAEFSPTYITIPLLLVGLGVNWLYESGGGGAKAFDLIIKIMVGIIVLSFFAVIIALMQSGNLETGKIFSGLIPNPFMLFSPSDTYTALIDSSAFPDYWRERITDQQRNVAFAAFGTAVGINMTFLLPYSILKKRWGKKHRGLSITDLSIGLFIPFFLATACVVIASASSFHGKVLDSDLKDPTAFRADVAKGFYVSENPGKPKATEAQLATYAAQVKVSDQQLAAMLQKRGAGALAMTLEPFAGKTVSQKIFGIGVLGMALSTIIILMLMNGLAFQEAFGGKPNNDGSETKINDNKGLYFFGCTLSGLSGCMFPLLWAGESKAALAVPTSVIGGSLIPIAYFTFLLMMNSKKILGEHRPKGGSRIIWNTLMVIATTVASAGSVWVLLGKTKAPGWQGGFAWGGLAFLALLLVVGTISFFKNERRA